MPAPTPPDPSLSPLVQEILKDVPQLTRLFRQSEYRPEHLLATMLHRGQGSAIQILRDLGVDLIDLSLALEAKIDAGELSPEGPIASSPEADRIIKASREAAQSLGKPEADTEHLLLALLQFDSIARGVLHQFKLDEAAVREKIAPGSASSASKLSQTEPPPPEAAEESSADPLQSAMKFAKDLVWHGPPQETQSMEAGPRMIDKTPYTPGMREVLKLSKAEAGRLGHDYIGPEHYLLGILRKGGGLAFLVLLHFELDIPLLKVGIEDRVGFGKGPTVGLFSPNAQGKRVLEVSKTIANGLKHGWVGTEHLLLALVKEESTISGQVLKDAGIEFEAAQREILSIIDSSASGCASSEPKPIWRDTPTPSPVIRMEVCQTPESRDIPLPAYATEHAAGVDLRAAVPEAEPLMIEPGQWAMVPTGLKVAIPVGFEGQVRPRSGLAAKHGIGLLNGPGTIDADYRGEIKVIMFNFSKDPFVIKRGERIAQLVLSRLTLLEWKSVEELPETPRGDGGFGHTGRE